MSVLDFKSNFDWKKYVSRYSDLKNCNSLERSWNHVNKYGWKEDRIIFADDNIQKAFITFKKTGVTSVEEIHKEDYVKELESIKPFLSQKDKNILVNTHSNLNITAGDTIMISNIMNIMMKNGNHITLLTEFDCTDVFKKNLEMTQYTIVKQNSNELISYMDTNFLKFDAIFIRNHNILNGLINKPYLNNTILYGLDVHLESISKMNNQFMSLVTQSEQLKNLYIEKGILGEKIEILEPIAMKYEFQIPERTDDEIRLIYCGTLRDEENILEIIEEFPKIHEERPEVMLKIVYGKIHGDDIFTKKINDYIKNGVDGIIFKHNLSHKDTCYEIATSDIGICWRKNEWGDNGEVSTKVKEYEMYGVCICNILKDLKIYSNTSSFINKSLMGNNIILLNNYIKQDNCLYIKSYSSSSKQSLLQFIVNNSKLIESSTLLSNEYITPNYIDGKLFKFSINIHIYGEMLSHIIVEDILSSTIDIETNYKLESPNVIKKFKDNKSILNKIAFIGDEFTFNSLNDIVNITYISKNEVNNINIDSFDMLLCESTWKGIDSTWKYAFNIYTTNKWSLELKHIVSEFKRNNKPCIFYNKEDPTNFEIFYNSAELFDIIITTSKNCIDRYKNIYPDKIIINSPFLCNPIIHNPIANKKTNTAFFVGGFYNHLSTRTDNTNKLLRQVMSNKMNLSIINRHYFFPKITRQTDKFKQHQNKYEINKEFKQFETPCISHMEALNLYKSSLFHLNINTVTECKTMSSRRMIELLACGCNILSNKSESIDYLNLPVIMDITKIEKNIFDEYNIDGFYLMHTKYSYLSLLCDLFHMNNIEIKNNVHIKISCKDETKIPEKYKNLLKSTKFDFELFIQYDNYYNIEIIEKLLVYPYFFNGNICFTDNKKKYFTIEDSVLDNDYIIKYHKDTKQTLFIPKI